jgi:ribosomal protein S18 acetylase RimI-like enzyme
MSDLKYIPISYLDKAFLYSIMEDEEKAWMADLGWDYSPVRKILTSFIHQKLLPGYVAVAGKEAVGYTYFLVNQSKGIIGAIYGSPTSGAQEAIEELIALTISSLKDTPTVKRVEAQIMPFNNLNLTAAFTRHGFEYYSRYYMEMNLNGFQKFAGASVAEKIIPWDPDYLSRSAEMTLQSYRDQTDAVICEDYRTIAGCENYLRSLVENPGCGIFMPEASFIGLDKQGFPSGFIITCRISDGVGMIPQIAVHPACQGRGLGNALMHRSFAQLRAMNFRSVNLTVSKKNRRAFDWYQNLGYRIRKEFGAYVWERE